MKKTITINNQIFELCGTTNRCTAKQRDIRDCYARPSETKLRIWRSWETWFLETGIDEYGVSSYNRDFFSIEAVYYDKETKETYFLVITKAHNRAWKFVA